MQPLAPPPGIPALDWEKWEKPLSLHTHLGVSTSQPQPSRPSGPSGPSGPCNEELVSSLNPSSPGFLPSAGVRLTPDGTTANLLIEKPQVVISRSWISKAHANKTREWKVRVSGDGTNNGFGAYVGITYAHSFDTAGFTLVFDANGNAQFDTTPSLLGFVHEYKHRHATGICEGEATSFQGQFPVDQKTQTFTVIFQADPPILEVQVSKSRIRANLDAFVEGLCNWSEARLAVYLQPGNGSQRKVTLVKPS